MAPFLTETLKDLIKTLMRKFNGKDLLDKSCLEMAKLDSTVLIIRNLPILSI